MKITIALAQMDISFGKPAENFSKIESFVAQAASEHADIVVFPEMWNTGYDLSRFDDIADANGSQALHVCQALAQKYHIMIHAGSVATKRDQQFFNTTYVFNEDGELLTTYDKVHLFGLMREDEFLTPGNAQDHFEVKGTPATSVICYDIRFPEWLRTLSLSGSRIIFVPAEWPTPRIPQWRTLLAARAIENQSFVVAVNRVGADPDNHFGGHSTVIDPLGNEVLTLGDDEELKTVTINTSAMDKVRGFMPVFADRRPDLYE